ncbi:GEVED domain-containing protein [Mangrovimonas aestuarii]|uniref:GEVED domain-containing protein n=1 Tax=Mangrovimonas aestuarii TaxID=3018443 RepID=UPI00237A0413|nr:GEVED domain-containing protein [Mangrovimonas aestuarii]
MKKIYLRVASIKTRYLAIASAFCLFTAFTPIDGDSPKTKQADNAVAPMLDPASFTPLTVSGYSDDVIANGLGALSSSTTNDVDGVNYCFLEIGTQISETSTPTAYGLPTGGLIESSNLLGLNFQLASYDANNSLRIATDGVSGESIITFTEVNSYETLYLAVTSGSGTSTISGTVDFSDGSSQTFTDLFVPDWYNSTALPVVISGIGRGNISNDGLESSSNNPRIYRLDIPIEAANQSKIVSGMTIQKTGNIFNLFAVSAKLIGDCEDPTNIASTAINAFDASVSWDTADATASYEVAIVETGEDIPASGNVSATTSYTFNDLTPETTYDVYVRTVCSAGGYSFWAGPFTFTTEVSCFAPEDITNTATTETTADFSWTDNGATDGYEWMILADGGDPETDTPIDSGIVAAGNNTASATGLTANTNYDFFVRADCGDVNGLSSWSTMGVYTGYCTSQPSSNDGTGIGSVQLGSEDFTSGGDLTYEDFTATPVDLPAGITTNVMIVFQTGYTYDTNIWIDFNDNLTFEASEQVFDGVSAGTNPTTLDASFLMPADATLGQHRMRIGTADSGQATPNPCYNGSWGVTADFTLNIIEASCSPSSMTAELSTDCDNDQFFVDVNVTVVGDATQINDGTNTYAITTTGLIQVGPYSSGTTVTLSAEHTDDTCDYDIDTFTYTCPIPGQLCESALTVDALPYSTTDDTANYFDDYSGTPGASGCGTTSNYLNGDDVIYAYTATTDTSIEVAMTPTATWSGIFVYTDCADIGTSCVAGMGNSSTSERIFDMDVTTGTTYYFVISTYASPQSTGYTFELTENTCTDATVAYTIVSDCDDSEGFFVDVDVTDMGSATSLTISDDLGSVSQTVMTTGIAQFGPYTSGAEVVFTVSDDNDANCVLNSDTLSYACPIPGQLCETALTVDALPYSTTDDTANYFDDYSGTPGSSGCGTTSNYLNGDDVIYAYTATADTSIEVSMTPTASWSGIFVYTDCADIGTNCVAGMGNSSTSERVFDMDVTTGTTYYFVISTYASPQSTGYTFELTENTCTDATVAYTIVSDCDDSEGFFIDVDVTDMGSATSLTIADDLGSVSQTVMTTGIAQFGPYTSGAEVVFTVSDDNDANCVLNSDTLSYACPIPGQLCETALTVDALPYSTTDDTANYFDDYSGTPGASGCGTTSSYLGGDDVIYTYTATADTSIEVSMTPTASWSGIFVYTDCADIGTNCVAGMAESSTNERVFDMDVVAGTTYYFVISTWPSPQSTGYTFELTDNTCSNATATYTVVDNCDTTGEFFVDVDITDMGSASSLTIADDFFGFVETATATGVVQFGPYTSGTSVSFTITDDNDASCEFTSDAVTLECTLGVEDFEQLYQFSYYPNPVSSNLVLTAQKNIQNVAVYNMLGQQIINATPNTMKVDLDMSNLQTGAYFVKVSIDGNLETIRVIKQ